jgi:hypothetical protein
MLVQALLALTVCANTPLFDFLDSSEIGPEDHFIAFDCDGKYRAEQLDKKGAKVAVMRGTWALKDDVVSVKVTGCNGTACKELKKDWSARIALTAERAMVVESSAPGVLFESGSYYCHRQGCERRVGVVLLGKGVKPRTLNHLLDYLIDQNRPRNTTVVWVGKKLDGDAGKTRIEYCTREEERARKAAQVVADDLAALPWVGRLEPSASAEKGCLWDVRVFVADDVTPPSKR